MNVKYFKNNQEYFNFLKKHKYDITNVNVTNTESGSIKIEYDEVNLFKEIQQVHEKLDVMINKLKIIELGVLADEQK